MEEDAKAYDEVSGPQIEEGRQFLRELKLSLGDKVLDMGCGTGLVTKLIADVVGPDGLVVGVDPDAERIEIAKENYKEYGNLQFCVGSSASGFLHDSEPYYDVHISTNAFHWFAEGEKSVYLRKAFECLKSGGKLGIWCASAMPDNMKVPGFHSLTQQGYHDWFQNVGLFKNVVVEKSPYTFRFSSLAEMKRWLRASTHVDLDDLDPTIVEKFVTTEDNGDVVFQGMNISIKAFKP